MNHLLVAISIGLAPTEPTAPEKRNVLFLMADDLSARALGCDGAEQCSTPHLDRLAERSMQFTRAYCQYPVCGPSRAALLSGLYPRRLGVENNGQSEKITELLGDRPSLPQWFRQHGWRSIRVGKIYHMRVPGDITAGVAGPDHPASWDATFDLRGPEWQTPGEAVHLSHEKLKFEPDRHYGLGFGTAFYVVQSEGDGSEQADAKAAARAVEILGDVGDEPFFLAVGMVRPHVPLVAPRHCFEPFPPEGMNLPASIADDWSDLPPAAISLNGKKMGLDDDERRQVLAAYAATVSFLDAQIGRVLDALDEHGLRDRTIVVFSSDHGYHLGEHDFWQKLSLHEESARIPLLISAPGYEPGVSDSLCEQIDVYPTLADLAGLPLPPHCQGRSLVPVLRDNTARVRDDAYCLCRGAHLLRTERFAWMRYPDGGTELYDMERDPHQFHNLTDDRGHAETRRTLEERLARRLDETE